MSTWLNIFICVLDLIASFVIVCLMIETTKSATVTGLIHGDGQSRWGMFRRLIYVSVAIALFAKSVYIYEGRIQMQNTDAVIWLVVVFALVIFPALRAFGIVDQDRWVGFSRRWRSPV